MDTRLRVGLLLLVVLLMAQPLPALAAAGPLPPLQEAVTATAAQNANLRAGPGTNYPVVGGVQAGTPLEIVARNADGTWYKLVNGSWIIGQLVNGNPIVPVDDAPIPLASATVAPVASASSSGWVLVAESAADFPGGRDGNNWYYLFTDGRGSFNWQAMTRIDNQGCYQDMANLNLEICGDRITTNARGDAAIQWKANKGGVYRFEWDSSSLRFYQHSKLVGIQETGGSLPYAATIRDVIEWELFFWVAADTSPFRIRVYRLEETAVSAPPSSATPAAAGPVVPTPAPPIVSVASFGSGTKRVGADVQPGTYRARGGAACYWERLNGFSGRLGNIIANEFGSGPQIVTISASDKGFSSNGCGRWTLDLSPIRSEPAAPFSDGTYFVGKDIAPGLWQSAASEGCYWETLSGFSGEFRDLHANDFVNGSTIVEIRAEDTGFRTQGCGAWTKIE